MGMLLVIKIGVFYGAPIAAVVLAVIYFAVLVVRVRRGAIVPRKAAIRYSAMLLLPVVVLIVVWGTAELTGYFALRPGQYVWNTGAAVEVLVSLIPLAAYVGMPIGALVVLFWVLVGIKPPPSP